MATSPSNDPPLATPSPNASPFIHALSHVGLMSVKTRSPWSDRNILAATILEEDVWAGVFQVPALFPSMHVQRGKQSCKVLITSESDLANY